MIMNEVIKKLDTHILSLRPKLYEGLNQPLSTIEIENLEKKYNIKLPGDLITLYKWKNGQAINNFDSFVNNSMFVSLEEALDTATELTSMIGLDFEIENWWNAKWIPIFHNGSGDYICYDCGGIFTGQQGQIIEFWHADNDRNVIAPTLEAFISKLNHHYETINADENKEPYHIGKIDGYPKRFIVE